MKVARRRKGGTRRRLAFRNSRAQSSLSPATYFLHKITKKFNVSFILAEKVLEIDRGALVAEIRHVDIFTVLLTVIELSMVQKNLPL